MLSQCPMCIVEKFIEVHVPIGKPEVRESGFLHTVQPERMPLAQWMALTTHRGMVVRCYCPQCGAMFYHPELFDLSGAPPAPELAGLPPPMPIVQPQG